MKIGATPLMQASDKGHIDIVKVLVKEGAVIGTKTMVQLYFLS